MRYPVYAPIAAQGVVEARGWTFSAGGGDPVSAVRGGWQNAQATKERLYLPTDGTWEKGVSLLFEKVLKPAGFKVER